MITPVVNLKGLQLGINPLLQSSGEFIRLVNCDSDPVGVKKKRAGYTTYLATPDNNTVNSLFEWHRDNGTAFNTYRASGSSLYYSTQGTGAWTICGNGTISAGGYFGQTILANTMLGGDGVGSTRHSTDGTSFTNTTGAPVGSRFQTYVSRAYMIGTGSDFFYSVTGDATNWSTTGTSDSSSLTIGGAGKLIDVMKVADRLVFTKNSGAMHRWDSYNLVDISTKFGPTSPQSVAEAEQLRVYLNRKGYYAFSGDTPSILSNAIRPQIYNDAGSGIPGGTFTNAAAIGYRTKYLASVGSFTDDFTGETVTNAVHVYDYYLNEFSNYSFGTPVSTFGTYTDAGGNDQLIFGDNNGQCYTYGGTATSDNGIPIETVIEFLYHDGTPQFEKKWNMAWFSFNPGCRARVQVAVGTNYSKASKRYRDLGDVSSGWAEFKFSGERGKILFVKITDSSTTSRFSWYGMGADYDSLPNK